MKKRFLSLSILLICFCSVTARQNIQTTAGSISGISTKDSLVTSYKGTPFAAAPVGDLRWKAPQPVRAWEGVRECTSFGGPAPCKGSLCLFGSFGNLFTFNQ